MVSWSGDARAPDAREMVLRAGRERGRDGCPDQGLIEYPPVDPVARRRNPAPNPWRRRPSSSSTASRPSFCAGRTLGFCSSRTPFCLASKQLLALRTASVCGLARRLRGMEVGRRGACHLPGRQMLTRCRCGPQLRGIDEALDRPRPVNTVTCAARNAPVRRFSQRPRSPYIPVFRERAAPGTWLFPVALGQPLHRGAFQICNRAVRAHGARCTGAPRELQ
jgi:hypothetical protein